MMKTFMYYMNWYPLMINLLIMLYFLTPNKNKFNPINLVFLLILATTMITQKMYLMMKSWSSFILFLIMIGGLMIIFLYIVSLTNNELFSINIKNIFLIIIKILIFLMIMILIMKFNNINYNMNINMIWFNQFNFNTKNFYEMYMNFYNKKTIFIIIYLYYSMIWIMNICYKFKSPLRQMFF